MIRFLNALLSCCSCLPLLTVDDVGVTVHMGHKELECYSLLIQIHP